MSKGKNGKTNLHAKNRSIVVGGNVDRSTLITGDGARVEQNVTMEEFLSVLQELRQGLRDAPLRADVAEDLEAQAAGVERQARHDEPNRSLILGKLKTITEVLAGAAGLGEKLVPLARRLGEMAAVLF